MSNTYSYRDGKWMMFFPLNEMDRRWAEACYLYKSGLLNGINSLKASTAKQNPMPERLHAYDEGIIIFYCGPSENSTQILEYGRNILNKMNYPKTYFYFKSDKPHLIDYFKPYRHMYYINTDDHYKNKTLNNKYNNHYYNDFGRNSVTDYKHLETNYNYYTYDRGYFTPKFNTYRFNLNKKLYFS